MKLDTLHNIYFIGIGGIGMSGLARYFKRIGKEVAGYDKTPTRLTAELTSEGIPIHFEDAVSHIPKPFTNSAHTLVVYTPAIPREHAEWNFFRENGFTIAKRAEVLGLITRHSFCYAVAGTHGKTTTSAILGHILRETGRPLTAFLGGISENFNSNFWMDGSAYTVVEADEFDRSFLHLSPNIACVTSMDADHLDIYGEKQALEKAFVAFTETLKPGGKLLVRKGLPLRGITYGIEDGADYSIQNIVVRESAYHFEVVTPTETLRNMEFHKPGRHNLLNALAALAMAAETGILPTEAAKALATFKGVQRRFSYQVKSDSLVFIDDYAHHPAEIDALYQGVREMHPGRKITAIFQPHLFSRTRDFADEFAASLARFDEVWLLDIYPAREKPIPGITSQWLLEKISNPHKKMVSKETLTAELKKSHKEVVLTIGAGDIGEEVDRIKNALLC